MLIASSNINNEVMKWNEGAKKKIIPAKPSGINFIPKLKKKSGKIVTRPVKIKKIEVTDEWSKKKTNILFI